MTVIVRPYWPLVRADGSGFFLRPADVRYPYRLEALGPGGRLIEFRPLRTRNPYGWHARLRFPAPGHWEIRVANYYAAGTTGYPATAPRLRVRVRGRPPAGACTAAEILGLVEAFVDAFNDGDTTRLDGLFARPPIFKWYSSGDPGRRIRADAYDRGSLMAYFRARHARRDRLRLLDFRFNGDSHGYGHFEYRLRRSAADYRRGRPLLAHGKGAASCAERPATIAVWSVGSAQ